MRLKTAGVVRHLPLSDPRNPNHPSQRANFLAMMGEMGRVMAAAEWERLYGDNDNDDRTEKGSRLRSVLK